MVSEKDRSQASTDTHRYADERIAEYLNENREWKSYDKNVPYHPQSQKDGDRLCDYFIDDLMHESEDIHQYSKQRELVYETDYDVPYSQSNVDLVIGPPANNPQSSLGETVKMSEAKVDDIWLAVDPKAIMTQHVKARKNRIGQLESMARDTKSEFSERTITCGIILLNMAERFDSPGRDPDEITVHPEGAPNKGLDQVIQETIDKFDIADTTSPLDFCGIISIEHTNLVEDVGNTTIIKQDPAPDVDEMTHYRKFVKEVSEKIEDRFSR